jgi:hypothetical protein
MFLLVASGRARQDRSRWKVLTKWGNVLHLFLRGALNEMVSSILMEMEMFVCFTYHPLPDVSNLMLCVELSDIRTIPTSRLYAHMNNI